jgi:tetratricopeptide (TPR) repeat protein
VIDAIAGSRSPIARPPQRVVALLLALILTATTASSQREEIRQLYQRGLGGDKAAVDECIAKLEDVLHKQPGNQLARVYLGSAYTLRSRDLGIGPAKLKALNHGLALMDEAVAAAPNDAQVRLLRALTTESLPALFGRGKTAREDFALLASNAIRDPGTLDDRDLQLIFYHAGNAAQQSGDRPRAVELWKRAAAHPVDAGIAAKTRAALEKETAR